MIHRPLLTLLTLLLAVPALAGTVTLRTSGGATVPAQEWRGGDQGVVLVHAEGRTSSDWAHFGEKLADKGYAVIAPDLRAEAEAADRVADVDAAIAHLARRGASAVTIIGAGLGANLAVKAASDDERVTNLVLLSPGMNLDGIAIKDPAIAYGERPLLLVASNEDRYAAKSSRFLAAIHNGPKHLEIVDEGSGARMLNRDLDLETLVVDWIDGSWREQQADTERRDLQTDAPGDLETTGVKFGDE